MGFGGAGVSPAAFERRQLQNPPPRRQRHQEPVRVEYCGRSVDDS